MSNNIIVFPETFGALAPRNTVVDDDLTAGISSSFGVVSVKGKVFRIKFAGNETPLLDARNNPIPQLDVAIVGASPHVSRTYYEGGFVENSNQAPTCSSIDGKYPDAGVEDPPARACASCPFSVRDQVTPSGSKVSACQNNKRIAVVPVGDLENEQFGGPMLMRIPGGSLKNLTNYGQALKSRGFASYQVVTSLQFDPMVAHPKLVFTPVRPLQPDEAEVVNRMRSDGSLDAILSVSDRDEAPVASDDGFPAAFNGYPPQAAAPAARPAPQPVARPVSSPQQVVTPVRASVAPQAAPISVAPEATDARPTATRRRPATKSQIAAAVQQPVVVAAPSSFETDLDAKLNSIL